MPTVKVHGFNKLEKLDKLDLTVIDLNIMT